MAAVQPHRPMKRFPLNRASPSPSQESQTADVWRRVSRGDFVSVGGMSLRDARAATLDVEGRMVHLPLVSDNVAFVAQAPLAAAAVGSATGDREPTEATKATALSVTTGMPQPDSADSSIPSGFVLSGTVKLFGTFEAPMYVYYGSAAEGSRQVVPIKVGLMDTLSSLIPSLSGSDYGSAVRLENTELVYNQLATATGGAGTWLQTDVVLSGPLQPVTDFLKNVVHQEDPHVRVQALLTPQNNWTEPISPGELTLHGTVPGIDFSIAGVLRITQVDVDISLSRYREEQPPYGMAWKHAIGFSGGLEIEMPQNIAPLSADFSMRETEGMLALTATVRDGDEKSTIAGQGFAGVAGLRLSHLTMETTLRPGGEAPSVSPKTGCTATAELVLRDLTLQLSGYYNKSDWSFTCDVPDSLGFEGLCTMYQDMFGAPLHLTSHDVELSNLSFVAQPSGLTLTGRVTIEGHTSADATIAISRHGLEITGNVADVALDGDIVLRSACLDVFVGRQDDTTIEGPGTSFRFAIQGVVGVADGEISARMFLDKDSSSKKALWTVTGSFKGAFRLSKIAPALRGTFLDSAVQEATLIASNVDGVAAAGAVVPTAFTVIKGVQVAGTLEPIPALDGALGVSSSAPGTEVIGLTLQALYSATSGLFEIAIQLPSAHKMSIKAGTVYSGPISLLVQVSESPTLVLNADFFVKVPNQEKPLQFSGGLTANSNEAKLFVELANQWWQNPFGLSPELKLGPNLALQVGIVYAGPVYPSEIGVSAGLAVGDVTGSATLSISETPTDELIILHVENLGIKDLVSFSGLLLQTSLPAPKDFLRFKSLDFYLSSGTTIGTVVYPPGVSFSCDAILFGHNAAVSCIVSKVQEQIEISGSLQEIDVGPVSIGGYEPGTPARLEIQFGAQQQTVAIDGGFNMFGLDARVLVKADIIPSPNFQLQTELDFTAHLTFQLRANMRSGTTGTTTGLQGLDFDVDAVFQQDLLDYIATQINNQVLAAKKAIDDGEEAAQKSLDMAQAQYQAAIDEVQKRVDAAKADYESKLDAAKAALSAEQQRAEQRRQELSEAVDRAVQDFNAAVDTAQRNLQAAKDERARKIQAAEQQVQDAKAKADRDIDSHLRDLNNARDNMNRQFGDAIAKIQSAKNDVNSLQGQVNDAQNALNNAQRDLDNAPWWNKLPQASVVAGQAIRLGSVQAAFSTAQGVLTAAEDVVRSPGYLAAQASLDAYKRTVDAARAAADGSIDVANQTLRATEQAQNALVEQADAALTLVKSSGVEKAAAEGARAVLDAFDKAEAAALEALQGTLDAVGKCTEAVAFETANAALKTALASTAALDAARAAVELAAQAGEAVVSAAGWMASHAGSLLDVQRVEVSGDLRGACLGETQLAARLVGTFAGNHVDFSVDFTPGKGEAMLKTVFEWLIGAVKKGVLELRAK